MGNPGLGDGRSATKVKIARHDRCDPNERHVRVCGTLARGDGLSRMCGPSGAAKKSVRREPRSQWIKPMPSSGGDHTPLRRVRVASPEIAVGQRVG